MWNDERAYGYERLPHYRYGNWYDNFGGGKVDHASTAVRLGFLRKVYGLLAAQLGFTILLGCLFIANETISSLIKTSTVLYCVMFVGTWVTLVAVLALSRETPLNFILLAVFDFFVAYFIGLAVVYYEWRSVIDAVALTLAVVIFFAFFVLQNKWDVNFLVAGCAACAGVLLLSIPLQAVHPTEVTEKVCAMVAAMIWIACLMYDTTVIMSQLSAEEYILGAALLHLDVLNLFLRILGVLGDRKD